MKNNLSFQTISNTFEPIFNNEKFFQIISSLSQIILLILILSWILKKIYFFKNNRIISCMKIIDRLFIGSHQSIIIVEIEGVKLVLGVTTTNITYLYTFSSILKDKTVNKIENNLLKKNYF